MVIFEDLRKLLLYQKLNLGFECQLCKRKFYNRIDHLEHTRSCTNRPDLKCPKCGKMFGHVRILQLHLKIHDVSESIAPQSPEVVTVKCERTTDDTASSPPSKDNDSGTKKKETSIKGDKSKLLTSVEKLFNGPSVGVPSYGGVNNEHSAPAPNSFKILETSLPKRKASHKTKEKPKPVKKQVGLTKIKMEDCLRCDACSCIYIDEKDYYKHMRNFHHRDITNAPNRQKKAKRKCQSCCKQCRGSSHCSPVKRPRASQRASDLIFRFNMKDNIKNRWSQMVSQQKSDILQPDASSLSGEPEPVNIKPDPDANITIKQEPEDLSYLLSQVEVKIKTEPPDDY